MKNGLLLRSVCFVSRDTLLQERRRVNVRTGLRSMTCDLSTCGLCLRSVS